MDCTLRKLVNFFKLFLCIFLEKSLKNYCSYSSSLEKYLNIFFPAFKMQMHVCKKVFRQIQQNRSESAPLSLIEL